MHRLHLIELEDLPWMPRMLRDGATDLLDVLFARTGFYRALAPKFAAFIADTGVTAAVDVCSGGGGGVLAMRAALAAQGHRGGELLLTDRYPNEAALQRVRALDDPAVKYRFEPLDAFDVPRDLRGMRTMFGALHHFQPPQVRRLLQNAVSAGVPIAFFDVAASPVLRRMPTALAPVAAVPNLLALVLLALALVPFARPFRWSRVVFSYLLPLIPVLFAWDGTVSALRAYTPEELLAEARALSGAEAYRWESGRSGSALFLLGRR